MIITNSTESMLISGTFSASVDNPSIIIDGRVPDTVDYNAGTWSTTIALGTSPQTVNVQLISGADVLSERELQLDW